MLRRIVRSLLYRVIKWSGVYEQIEMLIQAKDKDFHNHATYNHVRFYYESRVLNFQGDSSKIEIGDGTNIRGELLLLRYGGRIKIGENCYIGDHSRIWSGDSIEIGNNVLVSHNVNIIDTNSHEMDHVERAMGYVNLIKYGYPAEKGSVLTKPIIIKDHAWISFNVTILKGVTIGEGAVIGAGSVVTRDVEPWTVVGGNPAVVLKKLR